MRGLHLRVLTVVTVVATALAPLSAGAFMRILPVEKRNGGWSNAGAVNIS
jgi:hypothetical protein